ncbi:protein of unknown function [Shewanella benthica]|uniref:Uncharacterized protein n=1 Tax=Shewanella benthica TaxID=43661 RepID=A0A330M2X1_9GAMM|nr:hypothetical protein [Shewanella benthica]SQH77029.1 protein of unknown function [Shewanella benthica]
MARQQIDLDEDFDSNPSIKLAEYAPGDAGQPVFKVNVYHQQHKKHASLTI